MVAAMRQAGSRDWLKRSGLPFNVTVYSGEGIFDHGVGPVIECDGQAPVF